jgi:hypothetical protein
MNFIKLRNSTTCLKTSPESKTDEKHYGNLCVCVCVCVCARERERQREYVFVCVCVYIYIYIYIYAFRVQKLSRVIIARIAELSKVVVAVSLMTVN